MGQKSQTRECAERQGGEVAGLERASFLHALGVPRSRPLGHLRQAPTRVCRSRCDLLKIIIRIMRPRPAWSLRATPLALAARTVTPRLYLYPRYFPKSRVIVPGEPATDVSRRSDRTHRRAGTPSERVLIRRLIIRAPLIPRANCD